MVDIETFRIRIGRFCQSARCKRNSYFKKIDRNYQAKTIYQAFKVLQVLVKFYSIAVILSNQGDSSSKFEFSNPAVGLVHAELRQGEASGLVWGQLDSKTAPREVTVNFQARYKYGNKENMKGLRNFHLNIRSLANKISEVKNIVKEHQPHVLGISECELRKHENRFDENKLKVPGYDLLFPKSWALHGQARVIIYIKKTLQYERISDIENDDVQSVWVKAGFRNSRRIYICHTYREHMNRLGGTLRHQRIMLEKLLSQWEDALVHANVDEENEVHISGDMNLDSLNDRWLDPSYHLASLSNLVQSACNTLDLSQLVSLPTRSQYNSASKTTAISCIDHVYTNRKFRCSKVSVIPFGGSDHDLIGYTRFTKVPPAPSRTIRRRSYKKFEEEKFLQDLEYVDWTEVYSCKDVDSAVATFTSLFVNILNFHAPWVIYQERKNHSAWLTEETKELIKERNVLKKKAVDLAASGESDAAAIAWNDFKKIRNKVNNRAKYEEKNYKTKKISQNLDSPASTWRLAKCYMGWKKSGGPPNQLRVDNKLITKASIVASEMNRFFISKVTLIRAGIDFLGNQYTKCKEIMSNKNCKLTIRHISVEKVNKLLRKLKNSKSTSIDEFDNYCVKLAANIIDKPLHHIISLSLLSNKFPRCWKYSKVIPLHKKGCTLECKNYRPVAILSPLSKILEKVVYEQFYHYFSMNKIFHPNLHGYRHGRSTQTALLTMYDRWVRASVAEQVSGVVLLDLSAAFDLVDSNLLIKKLEIYGIDKGGLEWIHSYLTERYQSVWVDHVFSDFLQSDVGVPQGSILGPLMFLIVKTPTQPQLNLT